MRIALGFDHAGIDMSDFIRDHLQRKGYEAGLFGPENDDDSDYPVFAEQTARAVAEGLYDTGILICGTGAGMCIAANKVNGIRAVSCSEAYTARLAKEHNNANIVCIGARVVGPEVAAMIVDTFLKACFKGGRHDRRVALFEKIEESNRK